MGARRRGKLGSGMFPIWSILREIARLFDCLMVKFDLRIHFAIEQSNNQTIKQ
jgi:hypothetical protein